VTGAALPYSSASTDPARYNGQGVGYTAYHTPVPRINQWNLAIERELAPNVVVSLSYVASHAYNLVFPTNLNQIPQGSILSTGINKAAIPYPQYGENSISGDIDAAYSNYHSLQAQITKRMSSGVSFNFNYVWSHFLDEQDSSSWGSRMGPVESQSAYNLRANYGPSNFDVRNAFKGNVVYQLPFGKGKPFLNDQGAGRDRRRLAGFRNHCSFQRQPVRTCCEPEHLCQRQRRIPEQSSRCCVVCQKQGHQHLVQPCSLLTARGWYLRQHVQESALRSRT